jgi:hypothetical protein
MKKALYEISYRLDGSDRKFFVRVTSLTTITAWHWVAYDAGISKTPSRIYTYPHWFLGPSLKVLAFL